MATIFGTTSNDVLIGDDFDNEIFGEGGDDLISGGGGFDVIKGGAGDDTIDGGLGKGKLDGGAGDDIITSLSGGVIGGTGDDTINAIAQQGSGQIHIFAAEGDDRINIDFAQISNLPSDGSNASFGHHARGDKAGLHSGYDVFHFRNTSNVSDVMVGRLEDFDPSRDDIWIDGQILSFDHGVPVLAPSAQTSVRIVSFAGNYTSDPDMARDDAQQWLLIDTSAGGQIAYALEGARVTERENAGANSGTQESHFVTGIRDFDQFDSVAFYDPQNVVPVGHAPMGGLVINDTDVDLQGAMTPIYGSELGDLIAAGLNNDTVYGQAGDDKIWGGSGHDRLFGGDGDDTIFGGLGDNFISGGGGSDWMTSNGQGIETFDGGAGRFDTVSYADAMTGNVVASLLVGAGTGGLALGDTYAGVENLTGTIRDDVLHGDNNSNILRGLSGDDHFKGNGGKDKFIGGKGDDVIDGGANYDYAHYAGQRADFDITKADDWIFVDDRNASDGDEGRDALTRVEVLVFEDITLFMYDFF